MHLSPTFYGIFRDRWQFFGQNRHSIHATSLFAYINSKHTIPLRLLNKLKTLYVQLSPLISLHESLWGVFNVKCMILQVLYEASLYLFSPIMHFLEAIPSSRRRAYWEDLPQIPQATPTKPSCSFFFIANNTGALSHMHLLWHIVVL